MTPLQALSSIKHNKETTMKTTIVRQGIAVFGLSLMSLTLSACPDDNGSPSVTPPGATTGFAVTPGTSFQFTWNAVSGATFYRLFEDPTGSGTFTQIGNDLTATTADHKVPLWQRVNAQYSIQACNAGGCTASAPLAVNSLIANAIGYVKASNTGADDQFGVALALSGDGATLAIGAWTEDSNATGVDGNQADNSAADAGAVYVFTRSGGLWSQQAYAKAFNTGAGDQFGIRVALSGDGATLAVGAFLEDSSATGIGGNGFDNSLADSGAVYVFTRSAGVWSQQAYVKASNPDAGDQFGVALALSDDGATLAVGAYAEDSNATGVGGNQADNSAPQAGAVYVFTRSGGLWSQQAYVKASNTGAGDQFGFTLALSDDGATLAVGAFLEDSNATGINGNQADNSAADSGAVYVFTRSGGLWSQQAYVKASNTDAGDQFGGFALALSADGNTLAVGAWMEASNATGINGNQADNSAASSGAAYVFTRSAGLWSQQAYVKASNTDAGDRFGTRVALSDDGATLTVGAYLEDSNATGVGGNQADNSAANAGAAYIY